MHMNINSNTTTWKKIQIKIETRFLTTKWFQCSKIGYYIANIKDMNNMGMGLESFDSLVNDAHEDLEHWHV
jgi:hypothetical protein